MEDLKVEIAALRTENKKLKKDVKVFKIFFVVMAVCSFANLFVSLSPHIQQPQTEIVRSNK